MKILQRFKALRSLTILVITIFLLILEGTATAAGGPAGILLFHQDGDNIFLLLANDSKGTRGWAGFGGGANEGESLRETAARETEEETRGYFSRTWLLERIADQEPLSTRGFYLYFVEVPFVPAQRVMNNPVEGNHAAMEETQFYAWIPLSELEPILEQSDPSKADLKMTPLYVPRGCEAHSFWRVWIMNMYDGYRQQVFPWSRKDAGAEQTDPLKADPAVE